MKDYQRGHHHRNRRQLWISLIFFAVLLGGWRYPLLGYFIPLCMLIGIVIGIWRGRKWCDWLCPRGSFHDAFVSHLSPKRIIPGIFRDLRLRIAVLVVLLAMMGVNVVRLWPSLERIGAFLVLLLTLTTALAIILAFVFHQRSWCLLCPIGTAINLTGGRKRPLKIDSALCITCKLCHGVCPLQIASYTFKKEGVASVTDRDCLRCGLCISVCPKKALGFEK